ncbi:cis-3-chloroacrylic acid dehydrogenase [Colletotrichum tofieldiae]|uniref:Cis-3-chloroacrylic acid dehydrogenase n=1 Tax=Colletotrichum tofieldiae TaxID=708197 RepID=A0A166P767_9PEZI|nr:cis-3-chloroacrylic acid dehydrogenase [Colletotrichum tofieldiae]
MLSPRLGATPPRPDHALIVLPLTIIQLQNTIAFNTPELFVHANFSNQNAEYDDLTYFIVVKLHSGISNCIITWARTSASRNKEEFDNLAAVVEDAWKNSNRLLTIKLC